MPFYRDNTVDLKRNNFLGWRQRGTVTVNNATVFLDQMFCAGTPIIKYNKQMVQTVYATAGTLTSINGVCANSKRLFVHGSAPSNLLVKSDDGVTFSDLSPLGATARSIATNENSELLIGYTTGRRSWSINNGDTLNTVVIAGNTVEFNGVKWLPLHKVFFGCTSTGYYYGATSQAAANDPVKPYPGAGSFLSVGETAEYVFCVDANAKFWRTNDFLNWVEIPSSIDSSTVTLQQRDCITFNNTIYTVGSSGNIMKYDSLNNVFIALNSREQIDLRACVVFNDVFYAFSNTGGMVFKGLMT